MDFCGDILKELINSCEIFDNDDDVIKKYMNSSQPKKPMDYFLDSDEIEKLYSYTSPTVSSISFSFIYPL